MAEPSGLILLAEDEANIRHTGYGIRLLFACGRCRFAGEPGEGSMIPVIQRPASPGSRMA